MPQVIGFKDSRIDELILEQQHETLLFPTVSNLFVTFTADSSPDVFGEWEEIADDALTTLSSKITNDTHITGIEIYECNVADKMYLCEISYGASKTVITRFHFTSNAIGKKTIPKLIDVRSAHVPSGELVYYRMMCETASATLNICFRYHFHA